MYYGKTRKWSRPRLTIWPVRKTSTELEQRQILLSVVGIIVGGVIVVVVLNWFLLETERLCMWDDKMTRLRIRMQDLKCLYRPRMNPIRLKMLPVLRFIQAKRLWKWKRNFDIYLKNSNVPKHDEVENVRCCCCCQFYVRFNCQLRHVNKDLNLA